MAEVLPLGEGLGEVDLPGIPLYRRGKVRDTFDLGDQLLMVSTDRISAFDSVLPTLIPDRGRVLTAMSRYWFGKTADLVPNHLRPDDPGAVAGGDPGAARWAGHVRRQGGADRHRVCGEEPTRGQRLAGVPSAGEARLRALPRGLEFGGELPELRFTPATKNDSGHDENISRSQLAQQVGSELARRLEEFSLRIFRLAQVHCQESASFSLTASSNSA